MVRKAAGKYSKTKEEQLSEATKAALLAGTVLAMERLQKNNKRKDGMSRKFVKFWNRGSVAQFLTAFYKDHKLTKEEIEELRKIIDELEQ